MDKEKIKALLEENTKILVDFWMQENDDPIPILKKNNDKAIALLDDCQSQEPVRREGKHKLVYDKENKTIVAYCKQHDIYYQPSGVCYKCQPESQESKISEGNIEPWDKWMPFPKEWIGQYHNACTDPCDMLYGACACGATHHLEEWIIKRKKLVQGKRWVIPESQAPEVETHPLYEIAHALEGCCICYDVKMSEMPCNPPKCIPIIQAQKLWRIILQEPQAPDHIPASGEKVEPVSEFVKHIENKYRTKYEFAHDYPKAYALIYKLCDSLKAETERAEEVKEDRLYWLGIAGERREEIKQLQAEIAKLKGE